MSEIAVEAKALDHRTSGWLAASGFMHRALLLLVSIAASNGALGRWTHAFIAIAIVAVAANAVLAVLVFRGSRPPLLYTTAFLVVDVGFAVALNLFATLVLPTGTFLLPGRDVFGIYLLGTIVVWTSLRGIRTGAAILVGEAALDFFLIGINDADLTRAGSIEALSDIGWLVAGLIIPSVIISFAGKGTRFALRESVNAGREAERSRILTDLHDTALQAFAQIASKSVDTGRSVDTRIVDIRQIAADEIDRGTAAVSEVDSRHPVRIDDGLRALSRQFTARGLMVQLNVFIQDSTCRLSDNVTKAVLAAIRELLNNVLQHAAVDTAHVSIEEFDHGTVKVLVSDDGRGLDLTTSFHGYGLQYSVIQRIKGVGGSVMIWSHPGHGTKIEMIVPASSKPRRGAEKTYRTLMVPQSDSLEKGALGWFVIPALTYRACLTPLLAALALTSLPYPPSGLLFAAMGGIFTMDILFLCTARSRFVIMLFALPQFMAIDFSIAVAMNIWSAIELTGGTALLPGRQYLWGYMYGSVILWTGLRGPRTGAVIMLLAAFVEVLMVGVNHDPLTVRDGVLVSGQLGVLIAAFLITCLIAHLARRGVRLAVQAGDEAGRELARATELRRMFVGAMDKLACIVGECAEDIKPVETRLRRIRGIALEEINTLRGILHERSDPEPTSLESQLRAVVDSFRKAGLRVEFIATELEQGTGNSYSEFLARSTRAALQNVLDHAATAHVVVWASNVDGIMEIVVRDQGSGFPVEPGGPKVASKIAEAGEIPALGGTVDIWSAADSGTRVIIRVPLSPSAPDMLDYQAEA